MCVVESRLWINRPIEAIFVYIAGANYYLFDHSIVLLYNIDLCQLKPRVMNR
jgi:hypothetical protein